MKILVNVYPVFEGFVAHTECIGPASLEFDSRRAFCHNALAHEAARTAAALHLNVSRDDVVLDEDPSSTPRERVFTAHARQCPRKFLAAIWAWLFSR